ncbi:MAG: hypothetical protein EXS51_00500 [Candidatus Taylorbacteria bacterium]|nr:hypothetical protein [Candidatus Taylorbacteria bacterium]
MKDFLDIVKERKTIRSFSAKPVPLDLVKSIIEVASYAPTNCNQQLQNFIFVDDAKTKERLIKEAACNTLVRRAPALLVITYDGWNYKEAIQGGSLMLGHLMLAATYFGVHASPMNSYGSDEKVKKILHIPASETICCFVTLGYPDEKADTQPAIVRRPVSEMLHIGSFRAEVRTVPPFSYNPDDWTLDSLRMHQRYYCRKTTLGKEMDSASMFEREVVKKELQSIRTPVVDLFSYDGSYVTYFPEGDMTAVDLSAEVSAYTKASIEQKCKRAAPVSYQVYDEKAERIVRKPVSTITTIYKLERLPHEAIRPLFSKVYATLDAGGDYIIVARKSHLFWYVFFGAVKLCFGKDIRHTGIYNFFGPYRPISRRHILRELRDAGFTDSTWSGYFAVPAFIETLYEMMLQYIRSGGTTYLHREVPKSVILKFLKWILGVQGLMTCGMFGSVITIRCRK